jgi:hypothetical protein
VPLAETWRSLEAHSRRWIVVQFVFGAAAVNAAINATLAWLFTLGQPRIEFLGIPLVDKTTVLVDSLGTLFVLPFLTTLIVTTIVWREIAAGELHHAGAAPPWLPSSRVRRAGLVGATCFALLAPLVVAALLVVGSPVMSIERFVGYKALFGAIYGLPITPAVALLALLRVQP